MDAPTLAPRYVAERAAIVQDFLRRPFGLENLFSYVAFDSSEVNEWAFYNFVVERAGCHYMLDIQLYLRLRREPWLRGPGLSGVDLMAARAAMPYRRAFTSAGWVPARHP